MPRGLQRDSPPLVTRLRSMPRGLQGSNCHVGCKEISLYATQLAKRLRSMPRGCKEITLYAARLRSVGMPRLQLTLGLQGDFALCDVGCKEITLYVTWAARGDLRSMPRSLQRDFALCHVACKEIIHHLPRDYALCHVVARRLRSMPRDYALCHVVARRLRSMPRDYALSVCHGSN